MRTPAALLLALALTACASPDYGRPLPDGWPALLPLASGDARPDVAQDWPRRAEILPALERSIRWTASDYAEQFFPIEGVTRDRALASLERFRELLETTDSPDAFRRAIEDEFVFYKSAGWNGKGGGVLFTGYCTPILAGAREQSPDYPHPLYALPPDLVKGEHGEILGRQTREGIVPYPTRATIESAGYLKGQGLELVWLADKLDAFIAHVNGSAFIELEGGEMLRFGYSGKNGRTYRSLGKALVEAGELRADEVSLPSIREWAKANPDRLDAYLDLNESYVFFTPIEGNPRGSLNVEVASERSIATDKSLFPRGALVWVETSLPEGRRAKKLEQFFLDQDTGGAIRTAGRADLYLGIGPDAERRAGRMKSEGQMYYLFLKPALLP